MLRTALLATTLLTSASALAQVPVQIVAQQGIPAGNIRAPAKPAGFFNFGTAGDIWFGDEFQGWRHYVKINDSPLQYEFDNGDLFPTFGTNWSVGGGTACLPFCSVGQAAVRSQSDIYLAVYDHGAGGRPAGGQIRGGGIYHLQYSVGVGLPPGVSPIGNLVPLAFNQGLAGNQPTSIAYNPQDNKLYFGNLDNTSIQRLGNIDDTDNTKQTKEAVGTGIGKSVFAMAIYLNPISLNSDLFYGTDTGFYVIPNVALCSGNANNCAKPMLIDSNNGPVVAMANDGAGNIYYSMANGGLVKRYNPVNDTITEVASGLIMAGKNTNGLGFDQAGNLFIGFSPLPDDLQNSGAIGFVLASDLSTLQ